jgi:hypothetical protein
MCEAVLLARAWYLWSGYISHVTRLRVLWCDARWLRLEAAVVHLDTIPVCMYMYMYDTPKVTESLNLYLFVDDFPPIGQ